MLIVSTQTRGQTPEAGGKPKLLFGGSYVGHSDPTGRLYYDISPDEQRFIMLKEGDLAEVQSPINVVLYCFEELKHLAPTH